jgi:hypothetical protein
LYCAADNKTINFKLIVNATEGLQGRTYIASFKGKVARESEAFAKKCYSEIASALSSFIATLIIKQLISN